MPKSFIMMCECDDLRVDLIERILYTGLSLPQ